LRTPHEGKEVEIGVKEKEKENVCVRKLTRIEGSL
jgi:hypothetical protein